MYFDGPGEQYLHPGSRPRILIESVLIKRERVLSVSCRESVDRLSLHRAGYWGPIRIHHTLMFRKADEGIPVGAPVQRRAGVPDQG